VDNARLNEPQLAPPVEALLQAMRVWDGESLGHCERTAAYAALIAAELGVSRAEADEMYVGALLHDIGKMGVDLSVLRKPGGLDLDEREQVRLHPSMGAAVLRRVLPGAVVDCAAAHHEQPDGGGYPLGLTEPEIPLIAMVCRVADVLDSLTSAQTYRPALRLDEALAELRDGAGSRYSRRVVDALLRLVERDSIRIAA
jgi:putative nucleotidyltransferase with HDIG domain